LDRFINFDLQRIRTHINWVKVTGTPYSFAPGAPPSSDVDGLLKREKTPWLGTLVRITKLGSGDKGKEAVVKDVLVHQNTLSGLKIVVQFAHFNPASPFGKVDVDYSDVVEVR
jgi:hypothetical protein